MSYYNALYKSTVTLKAKFHYAIWFEADRSFEPVCNQLRTSFEPDSVIQFGFEPVCDQLRTSFEPAIVMEFGFTLTLMLKFQQQSSKAKFGLLTNAELG